MNFCRPWEKRTALSWDLWHRVRRWRLESQSKVANTLTRLLVGAVESKRTSRHSPTRTTMMRMSKAKDAVVLVSLLAATLLQSQGVQCAHLRARRETTSCAVPQVRTTHYAMQTRKRSTTWSHYLLTFASHPPHTVCHWLAVVD